MSFPWIKERVENNKLFTHGWYFDIGSGSLLGREDGEFIPVQKLTMAT